MYTPFRNDEINKQTKSNAIWLLQNDVIADKRNRCLLLSCPALFRAFHHNHIHLLLLKYSAHRQASESEVARATTSSGSDDSRIVCPLYPLRICCIPANVDVPGVPSLFFSLSAGTSVYTLWNDNLYAITWSNAILCLFLIQNNEYSFRMFRNIRIELMILCLKFSKKDKLMPDVHILPNMTR
jgi:hypothetical protein